MQQASLVPSLISICITTRHRPEMLSNCIASVLRQRYRPLQIIVGDNSEDDASRQAIDARQLPEGVSLIYNRHKPVLDIVANHNWTLAQATGTRLMLLHDDDWLHDGGLDLLVRAWDDNPDAALVYGRAWHAQADGSFDEGETNRLNALQMQSTQHAGRQACNALSALAQQMGPNGWLADTMLVRKIGGWRPTARVGTYFDIDFGVRMALACGDRPFVYVHEFSHCIRQGPTRLSSDRTVDIGAQHFRDALVSYALPSACTPLRESMLARLTEISVVEAARAGQRRRAFGLLRSPHYRRSLLSPHTIYRLIYIASPQLARMSNRLFRGL